MSQYSSDMDSDPLIASTFFAADENEAATEATHDDAASDAATAEADDDATTEAANDDDDNDAATTTSSSSSSSNDSATEEEDADHKKARLAKEKYEASLKSTTRLNYNFNTAYDRALLDALSPTDRKEVKKLTKLIVELESSAAEMKDRARRNVKFVREHIMEVHEDHECQDIQVFVPDGAKTSKKDPDILSPAAYIAELDPDFVVMKLYLSMKLNLAEVKLDTDFVHKTNKNEKLRLPIGRVLGRLSDAFNKKSPKIDLVLASLLDKSEALLSVLQDRRAEFLKKKKRGKGKEKEEKEGEEGDDEQNTKNTKRKTKTKEKKGDKKKQKMDDTEKKKEEKRLRRELCRANAEAARLAYEAAMCENSD